MSCIWIDKLVISLLVIKKLWKCLLTYFDKTKVRKIQVFSVLFLKMVKSESYNHAKILWYTTTIHYSSFLDGCFIQYMQNLASKDQSRLSEPVKELDILLTQVLISSFTVKLAPFLSPRCEWSFFIYSLIPRLLQVCL